MYLQKHITIIFCFTFISEEASYNRPGVQFKNVSDKVIVLKLAYYLTYFVIFNFKHYEMCHQFGNETIEKHL